IDINVVGITEIVGRRRPKNHATPHAQASSHVHQASLVVDVNDSTGDQPGYLLQRRLTDEADVHVIDQLARDSTHLNEFKVWRLPTKQGYHATEVRIALCGPIAAHDE